MAWPTNSAPTFAATPTRPAATITPAPMSRDVFLEFVEIAARAGYDGVGLRLYHASGGPMPLIGDALLLKRLKAALRSPRSMDSYPRSRPRCRGASSAALR